MVPKRKTKKTCLLFGEGASEKTFFRFLLKSTKFKQDFADWDFYQDNAYGCSCREILIKCVNVVSERSYDRVICFIDTDNLKSHFPDKYQEERDDLERIATKNNIVIIWQEENHEDEIFKASDGKIDKRKGMRGRLDRHSARVMRSEFVKNIISKIKSTNS